MSSHDVCIFLSEQVRYLQNIAFVTRRPSRRQALRKIVFWCLVALAQRYALPAHRFTHALCVSLSNLCMNYGIQFYLDNSDTFVPSTFCPSNQGSGLSNAALIRILCDVWCFVRTIESIPRPQECK